MHQAESNKMLSSSKFKASGSSFIKALSCFSLRLSTVFDLISTEYLRSISLPVPVVVEDTSSSSEYGSVSPDNDLNTNPFIFKPSVKCYSERDVKGPRSLFLR